MIALGLLFAGSPAVRVTVISMFPFMDLSDFDVAVIVTGPSLTPVTCPFSFTVAMASLEEDQVTVLTVAVSGSTSAAKVMRFPASTVVSPDTLILVG